MISRKRWEAGANAGEMIRSALHWVKNPARRARLYRVALVRRVWDELPWIARVLTELAEQHADGQFDPGSLPRSLEYLAEGFQLSVDLTNSERTSDALASLYLADYERYLLAAGHIKPPNADHALAELPYPRLSKLARLILGMGDACEEWSGPHDWSAKSEFDSIPILRDIFGNPFRSAAFSSS